MNLRLLGLVAAVSALACSLGAVLFRLQGEPPAREVLLFWILYCLAHWSPVEIPVSGITPEAAPTSRPPSLSAGFLVLMTVAYAADPHTAFVVGLLSPVAPGNWRGPVRTIFNGSQGAIYTSLAALTYGAVTAFSDGMLYQLVGAASGAFVAVALNTLLVAAAIAAEKRWSLLASARQLVWPAKHSLAFALFGLVVALIYNDVGFLGVFLLLTPLVILRSVRRSRWELKVARDSTLNLFVRAVEAKDPYTSRHSERVAVLTVELCRRLATPDDELEARFLGALLHDIGKIAVPKRILTKDGSLSEEEFAEIRKHPVVGADAVAEIDVLRELVPEIRHHHERMDGRGYPDRVHAASLPLAARVLAAADTFEALTSDRPYRRAMTRHEALAEIHRVAGTQLDPDVVAALDEALRDGFEFPASTAVHRRRDPGIAAGRTR
ncbi:MAG TPA: HD-GYP domain-containing protein [Actinomycetota bacterium]|nr:HD-GYP domain-containing protein [Actinomycetota bacterium]